MILPGFPTTVAPSGISWNTTAPAAYRHVIADMDAAEYRGMPV